jgi:DNA (cytosine-5)-methyltransferase 1
MPPVKSIADQEARKRSIREQDESLYYNEHDSEESRMAARTDAARRSRSGVVDERSITDVRPADLDGFSQCHFFAGIGVWSYALRNAGWSDERPVWTGSCPCQPFSGAGQRKGFEDERHLLPAWAGLIKARRPVVVFGEQVSDGDGLAWLDAVYAELDPEGYTIGAVDSCAAGFGAPMRSQRLYIVAEADEGRRRWRSPNAEGIISDRQTPGWDEGDGISSGSGSVCYLGSSESRGCGVGRHEARQRCCRHAYGSEFAGELAAPELRATERHRQQVGRAASSVQSEANEREWIRDDARYGCVTGPTNGFWENCEWVYCRDEKYRPVEPGTFPLVNGAPERVGRLRGYGDAIVAPQAEAFIRAYMQERGIAAC